MALIDDINNLPTTVGDGNTGHLNNHQVIHAALKDHEQRLGARHLIGTGSPEGRITATIGTQYTDQAATNGAIRWIKTSGTGATGWAVEYGDTGWRDVTGLVEATLAQESAPVATLNGEARVMIRRTDRTINLKIMGTVTATAIFGNLFPPPAGFRPALTTEVPLPRGVSLVNSRYWVRMEDAAAGKVIVSASRSVEAIWTPEAAWPTTLPGTPT